LVTAAVAGAMVCKGLSKQQNPTRFQLLKPWLPALKSVRHA
jgi:hypothetical protein